LTKKKILLTFDYELFFGYPSGSVENCLLNPTKKIIEIMHRYRKSATFFVDVMYLQKLYEAKQYDTICKIEEQIKVLVKEGHRVELHLHPHWLDAKFEKNSWIFPTMKHYRLHSLEESKIIALFKEGKLLLEKIAREVSPAYSVVAFRAGGWSIEPFSKLKNAFLKNSIKIDSSTGYGMKLQGIAHMFDFSEIPHKEFYRFEESVLQEDEDGRFLEVPISTYRTTIFHKILRRIRRIRNPDFYRMVGDGKSVGGIKRNYFDEIITYEMLSLESIEPKRLIKFIKNDKHSLVTLISHPKGMSEISFNSLDVLCRLDYDFISYGDLL